MRVQQTAICLIPISSPEYLGLSWIPPGDDLTLCLHMTSNFIRPLYSKEIHWFLWGVEQWCIQKKITWVTVNIHGDYLHAFMMLYCVPLNNLNVSQNGNTYCMCGTLNYYYIIIIIIIGFIYYGWQTHNYVPFLWKWIKKVALLSYYYSSVLLKCLKCCNEANK